MTLKKTHSSNVFQPNSATISSDQSFVRSHLLEDFDSSESENDRDEGTVQIGRVIQVNELGEPLEGAFEQPVGIVFQTIAGGELVIHADGSYEYHAPDQWYLAENNDEEMTESFQYSIHDLRGNLLQESVLTFCMTEEGPVAYNDYEDMEMGFENNDAIDREESDQSFDNDLPENALAMEDGLELDCARLQTEDRLRERCPKKTKMMTAQRIVRSVIYEGKIYSLSPDNTYVTVDGTSYNHFNGQTLFFDTALGGQFQMDMVGDSAGEYRYTAPEEFHRRITVQSGNMEDFPVEENPEVITRKFTFTLAPGLDASSVSIKLKAQEPTVSEAHGYWSIYRDGLLLAKEPFAEKFYDGIAQLELTPTQTKQVFDQLVLLSTEAIDEANQNQSSHFQVRSATFDLGGNVKEQVGYVLENADGTRTSSVLTIALGEENEEPVAVVDDPVFNEDQTALIQVIGRRESAENIVEVKMVSKPKHGWARVNDNKTITYLPHLNYLGTDQFIYQTLKSDGTIDMSQIHLAINPVNPVAVAVDNQYLTCMNQDLMISPQHLLEQDEKEDTQRLKIHSYTQPANGTLMEQMDENLLYRPHKDFIGIDHFSYNVFNTLTNDSMETKQVMIEVQKE